MKAKGTAVKSSKPPTRPPTGSARVEEQKAMPVDKSNPWGAMDQN